MLAGSRASSALHEGIEDTFDVRRRNAGAGIDAIDEQLVTLDGSDGEADLATDRAIDDGVRQQISRLLKFVPASTRFAG